VGIDYDPFFFIGVLLARYLKFWAKLWFKFHVSIQTLGLVALVTGFIIILVLQGGAIDVGLHQLFGVVCVARKWYYQLKCIIIAYNSQ